MNNLSLLIAKKRIEQGLTQEKLAEISRVSRTTIRRYEHGDFKNLDFYQLHNISKSLNINLLNYLSISCEGLTMDSFLKLDTLYHLISNIQKSEVEQFLAANKENICFKTDIGNELYHFAKALLYFDKEKYQFALDECSLGMKIDIRFHKIGDLCNKSMVYLKILNLAASCLNQLGNSECSLNIYMDIYNYISQMETSAFRNAIFYEDFFDFRIVTLCNISHTLNEKGNYKRSIEICDEAANLMLSKNVYKYFLYIFFNKALSLYKLNRINETKDALLQVYYFYKAIKNPPGIDYLRTLIKTNMTDLVDILDFMAE